MRDYGRVYCAFWVNSDIRKLSEDGIKLALYLLTSPHSNLIGCYLLPRSYAVVDIQWTPQRMTKSFKELSKEKFVIEDDNSEWILIPKYLNWNKIANPNQAVSAFKAFSSMPKESILKGVIAHLLLKKCKHFKIDELNSLETVVKRFPNALTVVDDVVGDDNDDVDVFPQQEIFDTDSELVKYLKETYPDIENPTELEKVALDAYPGIDLLFETKAAKAWEVANPKRAKKDHKRFLNYWWGQAQDRPRPAGSTNPLQDVTTPATINFVNEP